MPEMIIFHCQRQARLLCFLHRGRSLPHPFLCLSHGHNPPHIHIHALFPSSCLMPYTSCLMPHPRVSYLISLTQCSTTVLHRVILIFTWLILGHVPQRECEQILQQAWLCGNKVILLNIRKHLLFSFFHFHIALFFSKQESQKGTIEGKDQNMASANATTHYSTTIIILILMIIINFRLMVINCLTPQHSDSWELCTLDVLWLLLPPNLTGWT